jgi:hypothetical protein
MKRAFLPLLMIAGLIAFLIPGAASAQSACDTPDNAESVQCKVNYIKANGLGGGYVWALKDDDTSATLTKALGTDLNP